jgi:hypothetical protein
VAAITAARRRLLAELLEDWTADERQIFPRLLQRFAASMKTKLGSVEQQVRSE